MRIEEELKWSQPCYTFELKNIPIITAFKDYAAIAFFKGALLTDKNGLIIDAGENSGHVKQLRFNDVSQIIGKNLAIKKIIKESIKLTLANTKVQPIAQSESLIK